MSTRNIYKKFNFKVYPITFVKIKIQDYKILIMLHFFKLSIFIFQVYTEDLSAVFSWKAHEKVVYDLVVNPKNGGNMSIQIYYL